MSTGRRVFLVKTFARWANGLLTEESLCQAAREVAEGRFEADLGTGVCKKRVAVPGRGKSGSTRTLIAKQHQDAIFFIAGRQKSDPGTDFADKEVEAAKIVAKGLQASSDATIGVLLKAGTIQEICHDSQAGSKRTK
jgi:hypothetical protein